MAGSCSLGAHRRCDVIHDAWCPRCRERVPFDAQGRCLWCDEQTGGGTAQPRRLGRAGAGSPIYMGDETLLRARELYASGLSVRAAARELHPETAYASPKSLAAALHEQFRLRGWALRSQAAVTAARNHQHGLAARDGDRAAYRRHWRRARSKPCAGVKSQPPRVGDPCRRRAMEGSDYCIAHDPERAEWRAAHLAAMRARRPAA